MTKTMPSTRNAIAFADFFGNFARGCHVSTRLEAQRWEDGDYVWVRPVRDYDQKVHGMIKFYEVTEAGRAVAATGSLAKALAQLTADGFRFSGTRSGRTPKSGYIDGFTHEDGRTAWISNRPNESNVYVNHPRGSAQYTIGSQLSSSHKPD